MLQGRYEYVDGSAARQIQYDVYEENEVLREKKRYRSRKKAKRKFVMTVMAVFFSGLAIMYRYAAITKLGYEISRKENEYNELRNTNAMLKVEIETETDLAEIKEAAETRLGMQMPEKSQIVYIKVPRNDYTIVMDAGEKDDGGIFGLIAGKAAGLAKLFG